MHAGPGHMYLHVCVRVCYIGTAVRGVQLLHVCVKFVLLITCHLGQ